MFVEPIQQTQKLIAAHFPQAGILQLQETGLIGLLPGRVPPQEIPSLIDALLAAPVLVTIVQYVDETSFDLLADLREQAADLMLVGADLSGVQTAAQMATAVTLAQLASAQFLVVPLTQAPFCLQAGIPHIPLVHTITETAVAVHLGYQLLYAHLDPQTLAHWRQQHPTFNMIAAYSATPEQIPTYINHQATAVAVPLWTSSAHTMRMVITKARQLTAAWHTFYPLQNPLS